LATKVKRDEGAAAPKQATLIPAGQINQRTTVGVFYGAAERFKERTAMNHLVHGEWQQVTWDGHRERAVRVACALINAGVRARDSVALLSENRLEWLYVDAAIQSTGAVTVPIYPNSTPEVARKIAADCGAVLAIVSDESRAGKLEATSQLRSIVRMDREIAEWVGREPPSATLEELNQRLAAIGPEDVCTIIYTSGTTGDPKGVVLLHRNFADIARSALSVFDIGESDVELSWLPFAHSFERIAGIFVGMGTGAQTFLSRGVDHLGEDIRDVRPTIMCSVPRVYEKMYGLVQDRVRTQPAIRRRIFDWGMRVGRRWLQESNPGPLLRLQHRLADRLVFEPVRTTLTGGRLRFFISGGAALSTEVEGFFWAVGVKILNGWGLSETSAATVSNTEHYHRFGTVGRPLPGVELKIAGDGEILVRGPGVMKGYHNNREATAEVLDGEWFKTGDVGEIDADGFLKITDRKKDLFKTAGGKYIAPQQLEFGLQQDEITERAMIVGDGKPYVTALIVPNWKAVEERLGRGGDPKDLVSDPEVIAMFQGLVNRLNATLGSWETIKYFTLLPHDFSEAKGELTPTLKIKRKVVLERYSDDIEGMYRGKTKPG
jgi:long-chain acyl-CoA synthetase